MAAEHPPASRFWHQGFGRMEYPGGEVVLFGELSTMLAVMARSMLSGFIVEPVEIDLDDGEPPIYGFREVPKKQLKTGKKARSRIGFVANGRSPKRR